MTDNTQGNEVQNQEDEVVVRLPRQFHQYLSERFASMGVPEGQNAINIMSLHVAAFQRFTEAGKETQKSHSVKL